jgi:surface protein
MENNLNTKLNKINENVHSMKTGLGLEETSSIEALTNKVLEVRRVKPMTFSFRDCRDEVIDNLDLLDISAYSDLRQMFEGCDKVKNLSALRNWDVSQVRYMSYAFHGCDSMTDFSFLNN